MVIIGDELMSKIIEKVIDVGFQYLADQYARHTGMKDELQRLKEALPGIKAVVKAADNIDTTDLEEWLREFKDALYEANDAIDDLEYLWLQKQVEADDDRAEDRNNVRKLPSKFKQSIIKFGKHVINSDPTLENLRRAVKRLDKVAAQVGNFIQLQQLHHKQHQSWTMSRRATGSLVTEPKVFGRDSEKEKLLQWLMNDQPDRDEENNFSFYSVVGHGGMGKTTLAQLVFNDENVQKSFDLKMWVCLSTSFDVIRITADILQSVSKKRPEIDNLVALQDALKDKLMSSKKFLLVLDDAWNGDNCSDWQKLLAPFRYGPKGSKILLTTRMEKVAKEAVRAMDGITKELMKLNPLHEDEFLLLFNRYAFEGASSSDYKELHPIGMQIARRLGGSPLAAKTTGALLNSSFDEGYWTNILNCENISEQGQQQEGNIRSILMLSYRYLPLYLRPLFAFCSTFPQDHGFDKEDLVLKWMALGLIQSSQNHGHALENIGSSYFDELLNRSFFEQQKNSRFYTMHDLLHDLAHSVSNGECFSIVNVDKSVEDIPKTVRHLYLDINNLDIVMKVDKWQQLYSLQLRITSSVPPQQADVLEMMFKSLKCVRLLELKVRGDVMRVLPDVFGHLRHLRSLTIDNFNSIDKLPVSLCKLYNLQVLQFPNKGSTVLPENINNLINLRHLMSSSWRPWEISHPPIARVRKLSSLQGLSIYIKKERGYKIEELEGLNMIRKLHLQGLENVESPEEASMAKLGNKEHLRMLTLEWKWSPNNDTERNNPTMDEQQQILDCLQPHPCLKELVIVRYKGVDPAKWMDFELVKNIQTIYIYDCSKLEHLPSFGKLPFLKYLYLRKMPLIKKLDCDCQQLEELHLLGMKGLEELSQSDANSDQWCPHLCILEIVNSPKLSVLPSLSFGKHPFLKFLSLTSMPLVKQLDCDCQQLAELHLWGMEALEELSQSDANSDKWCPRLHNLIIQNSPKLSVLPSLPLSLKSMNLNNVGLTALPKLQLGSEGSSLSLQTLQIRNCKELMSIEAINALQHLGCLTIDGCPKLVCTTSTALQIDKLVIHDPMLLLTESFRNLTSLRELWIINCSELESISDQMEEWLQRQTTLNSLSLGEASSLKSLPDSLQTFSSLKELSLAEARLLQSVPRLPSSLERLAIVGCNETLMDRCQKEEGADWPNINHICNIWID